MDSGSPMVLATMRVAGRQVEGGENVAGGGRLPVARQGACEQHDNVRQQLQGEAGRFLNLLAWNSRGWWRTWRGFGAGQSEPRPSS